MTATALFPPPGVAAGAPLRMELSTRQNRASYERGFYQSRGFVESLSALFRMVL